MTPFQIEIPMKDHPMVIEVKHRDEKDANTYDVYYNDQLCGCMFCNEHSVWIYEPHEHAGLLLNPEQIQHLGREISNHAN